MSKLSSCCVAVPTVIEAIHRLPTERAELLVLEFLLRQRMTHGSSIEQLYAGLLSQAVSAQHALPDLVNFLPKTRSCE